MAEFGFKFQQCPTVLITSVFFFTFYFTFTSIFTFIYFLLFKHTLIHRSY